MEVMHKAIDQRKIAGQIRALKRKKKQEEQLKQLERNLRLNNSIERPFNGCLTSAQQIKENKNKEKQININAENETEKFEELNQKLLSKQLNKDIEIEKFENLAVSKENEILF